MRPALFVGVCWAVAAGLAAGCSAGAVPPDEALLRARAKGGEHAALGADSTADWILLLAGYEADVVQAAIDEHLSSSALRLAGASEPPAIGHYRLAFAMTSQDVAP